MDRLDALALVGLALLNAGLWQVWAPLAPLVTGALILAVVWRAAQRREEGRHGPVEEPAERARE